MENNKQIRKSGNGGPGTPGKTGEKFHKGAGKGDDIGNEDFENTGDLDAKTLKLVEVAAQRAAEKAAFVAACNLS